MSRRLRERCVLVTIGLVALMALLSPLATAADVPATELVLGTAVLLNQSGANPGGGGAGSTTSGATIFSPAAYVDYKRFGGEPTALVDRYPFPGTADTSRAPAAKCPPGLTTCYKDLVYVSSPEGVGYPGFSFFWKSTTLGQTFRLPPHDPIGKVAAQGPGGGDSHQAVGQRTHAVFFLDLPGDCVTINVSRDLGETFVPDPLGCALNPGVDDRQWVDADETAATPNVYISFINFTNALAPTLSLARSRQDAAPGTFATDSTCNTLTLAGGASPANPLPAIGAADTTPTACPDPADPRLQIAGPVVADKSPASPYAHRLYIPFIRGGDSQSAPPYELWVAHSDDLGATWTRSRVAAVGYDNPANIFPQLTIDTGGNLYYTWSQTRGDARNPDLGGETDVYYTYSTDGGATWAAPIDLTPETGDSAVFAWLVAGDPGRVDLVYYRSNSGLNPNAAGVDGNGAPCDPDAAGCEPNPAVWNVYFAQSLNALNPGASFASVRISDHPNHVGQVCTVGLACETGNGNRRLLDFFTVDVDHIGAANVAWADDNDPFGTHNKFSRQLAGTGVFTGQRIALQSAWPIRDRTVYDPPGDVRDANGLPATSTACLGMDLLATSTSRAGDLLTVALTLGAPPAAGGAVACGRSAVTGGLWGAEFWAADSPNDNFYVAYRDNPPDGPATAEAGRMDSFNPTFTANEFNRRELGTLGGSCFSAPAPTPCTITLTVSLSGLGLERGAGLSSVTGLSVYLTGQSPFLLGLPITEGYSQQADVTAALDDSGASGAP